jgi:hypothetical protein
MFATFYIQASPALDARLDQEFGAGYRGDLSRLVSSLLSELPTPSRTPGKQRRTRDDSPGRRLPVFVTRREWIKLRCLASEADVAPRVFVARLLEKHFGVCR